MKDIKVIAFNGSGRKDGNTSLLVKEVFSELEKENIKTEMIQLAGHTIRGCFACGQCKKILNKRCANEKDIVNDCIEKMIEADGIIFASPVYFSDITAELKALIDRSGTVARANGHLFKRKIGAAIASARRAGFLHALASMNNFFQISQMITPGSSYWNLGFGREIGDVMSDEEGLATMRTLGQNMAWLLKKTCA